MLSSWLIGISVVLAAGWAIHDLRPDNAGAVSISGLIRFIPLFFWESLRGAIDLDLRTLAPHMLDASMDTDVGMFCLAGCKKQ